MVVPSGRFKSRFIKAGDLAENEIVEIIGEGVYTSKEKSPFKRDTLEIEVKTADGEGLVTINTGSYWNIADAYGKDTKDWIGEKLKATIEKNPLLNRQWIVFYPIVE